MKLFALALISSYYACNSNASEFCFGKAKVLKNDGKEGWCGFLTQFNKDRCEKSYTQVGSNPAKQCKYNSEGNRCIIGDECPALPDTTTAVTSTTAMPTTTISTTTISTTTSATETSTATSTSTTTQTSTNKPMSTTTQTSTTTQATTITATQSTTTSTILDTTLASSVTTEPEAVTTIVSSTSISTSTAILTSRKTTTATITIASNPTVMATPDTLPPSTSASAVDTSLPEDLTFRTTTTSSTPSLRRTTFPTTVELRPYALTSIVKRKKFDLMMFIVVASVVFVGAALCIVAVVLVAMLARKMHQDKYRRRSVAKRVSEQITTAQSLKERPSIIMSDESYDEPVQQYKTSNKPRPSSGGYHRKSQYPRT